MQRVCLAVCPSAGNSFLICRPNSVVTSCNINGIYSATLKYPRLGGFCMPTNATAEAKLFQTANLQNNWNFLYIFDSLRLSLLISLGLGCIWVLFVQCLPRIMANVVTVLAILALGFLGVLAFMGRISGTSQVVNLVVGFILIGIAVLFACFLCFYRMRNKLISIFLEWATRYFK